MRGWRCPASAARDEPPRLVGTSVSAPSRARADRCRRLPSVLEFEVSPLLVSAPTDEEDAADEVELPIRHMASPERAKVELGMLSHTPGSRLAVGEHIAEYANG